MHKIVVLYPPPTDPLHFRQYYESQHLPLLAGLPGLRASRHCFQPEGVGAPAPFFCIWEGEFDDAAAMGAAMQSDVGQRVAADTANYASGGAHVMHYAPIEGQTQD